MQGNRRSATTSGDAECPLDRMAAAFGVAAVTALARGLRDLLVECPDAYDAGRAHRLAGLTGTVGFTAAARAWSQVSHGDEAARLLARDESEQAVARIDAWLAKAAPGA